MTYKLKKDLPFTKAGTLLTTELKKGWFNCTVTERTIVYVRGETFSNAIESISLGWVEDLLREGWIEEVKPKEFIVELYGKDFQLSRIIEIKNMPNDDRYYRYIKVREVIE